MDQSGGQPDAQRRAGRAAGPISLAGHGADDSGGRVLIASNRGPVSFAVGDDGSLVGPARRRRPGLRPSSVKDHADVLWVCAALSDADRAAARAAPDGRLDAELTPGKPAVQMLDIPAGHLPAGLQLGGQLHALVRASHALRHAQPARASGSRSAASGSRSAPTTPRSPSALADGAGRGPRPDAGVRPGAGDDPGLSPAARPADARRAAPRRQDRAFLAHAVGAPGLLPAAAGRGGPRGAGRDPRRGSRRLPVPALGRRLPRLLRRVPRRVGGPGGRHRPVQGQADLGRRAPARRGRGRTAAAGGGPGRPGRRWPR